MRAFSYLLFVLSISIIRFEAKASDLIISDIDDTIKVSHILDTTDKIKMAFRTRHAFRGMSELFRQIVAQNPGFKTVYVSNAINWMMEGQHQKFLDRHGFPKGSLHLWSQGEQSANKYLHIARLIEKEKPKRVLFFGDNGEKDIDVYEWFHLKHPEIKFYTYIHIVYSQYSFEEKGLARFSDQIPYATPVEVYLHLQKSGFLSKASVDSALVSLVPEIENDKGSAEEGVLSFPDWMDCSDMWLPFLSAADKRLQRMAPRDAALERYNRLIHKRCSPLM